MNDIERALAQISDIKAQLAASTHFRGYAPEVLVGNAVMAALLTIAQMLWPEQLAADGVQQVVIWGVYFILSSLAMAVEAVSRARWKHGGMAMSMLQSAMRIQLPATVVGVVIGFGICRYDPEAAWIVPGIWLLLISMVAFATHGIMPRTIVWGGIWYGSAGTLGIMLAGPDKHYAPWMIGVPLFCGHLFIARILKMEGEETHVGC